MYVCEALVQKQGLRTHQHHMIIVCLVCTLKTPISGALVSLQKSAI